MMCDPAAGTCGFPVAVGEYLREHHPSLFLDERLRRHFHKGLFHAYDFDPTMLRIGAMNMILRGVEDADVTYRDSLAQEHTDDAGTYCLAPTLQRGSKARRSGVACSRLHSHAERGNEGQRTRKGRPHP